jgi:hypothetical protein
VVLSNVLRRDSAQVHKDLASEIHAVIDAYHAVDQASSKNQEPGAPASGEPVPVDRKPIDEMDGDELDQFIGEDAAALELDIPGGDSVSLELSDSLASNAPDTHLPTHPNPEP